MKPLQRPEFARSTAVYPLDALADVTGECRTRLIEDLKPSLLQEDSKAAFLEECGKLAWLAQHWRRRIGADESQRELDQLATKARGLLQAMAALSPDTMGALRAHATYLQRGSAPPVRLAAGTLQLMDRRTGEHELLAGAWDVINDLEQACRYASAQITPSRQSKPTKNVGKVLVLLVASKYIAWTGVTPPKSAEGWFAQFMAALGKSTGIAAGAKLVHGVLTDMESRQHRHPDFDLIKFPIKDTSPRSG